MKTVREKLAFKIVEGYQSPSLMTENNVTNVFYRKIKALETRDISFILGISSSGLRSSAFLDGHMLLSNINQFMLASRWHLPIVVNTSIQSDSGKDLNSQSFYGALKALQFSGCFQFVASSIQEEVYLTLIAHRVSELSLVPGIVISDYSLNQETAEFPSNEKIKKYLGSPDDQIECPTPSQKMIFGKHRRRIPSWYNYDTPVQMGSLKNQKGIAYENAARIKYFQDHLDNIISQAFQEFQDVFKIEFEPVTRSSDNTIAIISYSGRIKELLNQVDSNIDKTEYIHIKQIHPFPKSEIEKCLKKKKSITVLEDINFITSGQSMITSEIENLTNTSSLNFYSAGFSPDIRATTLKNVEKYMLNEANIKTYFLGLSFFNSSSKYPKQEIHFQEIKNKYPELVDQVVSDFDQSSSNNLVLNDQLPATVKNNKNTGPAFTRLSHFYETNAFFHKYNITSELVADPFASLAIMPASSAELFSPQVKRDLPKYIPEKCTACGKCYMLCPHSALPPIAIGVVDLMKSGASLAISSGNTIKKLIPHYKNLSRFASKLSDDLNLRTVTDLVSPAFEKLIDNLDLKPEDEKLLKKEFHCILEQIGDFPISLNDVLYNIPSRIEAGSGKLLSIIVNPMSCTGCGICQEVCEDDAIVMQSPKDQDIKQIYSEFRAWEKMPDTATKTINQLHLDDQINSLAAILLSRNYYMSMSGYSPDESENAAKSVFHLVSSISEAIVQPGIVSQLNYIDKLTSDLSDCVHKELSDALPDDDITELGEVLKTTLKKKILVRDIVDKIREETTSKYINTAKLGRKIELIKSLKELSHLIKEGPRGRGRSRFGLVISSLEKFKWAGNYPHNHFSGPSAILSEDTSAEYIIGLMFGQIRFVVDQVKLLRRANLEIKDKYDPAVNDQEIAMLDWDDLTEDEKSYLPKIIVLTDQKELSGTYWHKLVRLLSHSLPVKVVSFDSATSRPLSSLSDMAETQSRMMSGFALKDVYIYQGSLNNADRFFEGISMGLDNSRPAFFNLFVPDNSQFTHQGKNIIELSTMVQNCRKLPDFSYLKEEKDKIYNTQLDIDWNNASEENWKETELNINGKTVGYKLSWADWAFCQKAWQKEFVELKESSEHLNITDYIKLNLVERKDKIPVIKVVEAESINTYSVSPLVIQMTEVVLEQWRDLQRMKDKISDFPDTLKKQVKMELKKEMIDETKKIEKEYEQKLIEQQDIQKKELKKRLKEKLLMLSKIKKQTRQLD